MGTIAVNAPMAFVHQPDKYSSKKLSVDDFIAYAQTCNERVELIDGQIVAMTGGTSNHSLIAVNMLDIKHFLRKHKPTCKIYNSDFGVQTKTNQLRYLDFCVACNVAGDATYTTSPILVGEVLSKSNNEKELGEKINEYKNVHSIQEIVLISQTKQEVTIYRRGVFFGWSVDIYTAGMVDFKSIGHSMMIDEIYLDIDLTN